MKGNNFIRVFLIGLLVIIVFLLAFLLTSAYHAERSYERTMIEMENRR